MHCAVWGPDGGRNKKISESGEDSPECAALLLDHGANLYSVDKRGYTPIHMATLTNAPRSVKFLIERGCSIKVKSNYGWTPLHTSLRFGSLESFEILLRAKPELGDKDVNNFEAFDYLLIYNQVKVLDHIYSNYPAVVQHLKDLFVTLKALEICIDNDSAEVMEKLVKRHEKEYVELVEGYSERLVFRCIAFNSLKSLKILEGICKYKVNSHQLELAVYYSNKELFEYLVNKYYKENNCKLEERTLKASIYMKKIDYAMLLLNNSKECKCEYKEGVIEDTVFDWSVKSMGRFHNIKMIKRQIPFLSDVNLNNFSLVYSTNSILHLAIETDSQEFILKVLETNINLRTKRRTDNATPLIIATKVCVYSEM